MDDYSFEKEVYVASLEKRLLDANMPLPDIYGDGFTRKELSKHQERIRKIRYPQIYK